MDRQIKKGQGGLSLIEGIVAAAIVGIGFTAVFNLSTASTNILLSSIDREKGLMLTSMIMEDLLTDQAGINKCADPNETCSYHEMDFTQTNTGDTVSAQKQKKWFQHADRLFGAATVPDDKREITVIETTNDAMVITVEIKTREGRSKNKFKRIINGWSS